MLPIKVYQLRVPVDSKVELWTSGTDYRSDAAMVHQDRDSGATQKAMFDHAQLQRPATPDPPASPESFQVLANQTYTLSFVTEFLKTTAGQARIKVVITYPKGDHPADDPTVFDLSGTEADRPVATSVMFDSWKK